MNKWNLANRYRDMPMERKLIVIFLFLIILPISSLSYFSFDRYSQSIEDNTTAYVAELARKLLSSLDEYIADMKRLSAVPGAVEEIRESLRSANEYYESAVLPQGGDSYILPQNQGAVLAIQKQVEESIYFLNSVKEGASSIYLFDRFGNGYYRIQVGGVRSDILTTYDKWKTVARGAGGNAALVSTQEFTNDFNNKRYVFTVVREIYSPTLQFLGMIAVDANISVIERYVQDLDKVTGGETLILDENDHVIFDSGKQYLAQDISEDPMVKRTTEAKGSFYHTDERGERIVIYDRSASTGWKVVIAVPVEQLTADAIANRNFTLFSALGIIGFALIMSIVLSIAITRPLRSLMQLMKHVQSGNLDVVFPVKRRDEVGLLGFHFNRMIGRIRDLINDNYHMQLRRKEAELLALQSQINPHFLHNTLESIRMTAEVDDNPEVADMIHLLGKLLRYSVNTRGELVLLGDELSHLDSFMRIIDYRYPGRFRMVLESDFEALRSLRVVKLIFQPIVENAVLYGFDERQDTAMTIAISYERNDDAIVFRIRDDGAGMEESMLRQLQGSMDTPPGAGERMRGSGIGLRNVNERIRLFYGEKYGIDITSILGEGTEVKITLPYRE